jgi:predicted thioesterase
MEYNSSLLKPGRTGEKTDLVTNENTALACGSGGLAVYATPALAALMEGACVAALNDLPEGISTVGTYLEIKHLSATPVGMRVRAAGELVSVENRTLSFTVEAFDSAGKIGEGVHRRVVIENEKFMRKVQSKTERA